MERERTDVLIQGKIRPCEILKDLIADLLNGFGKLRIAAEYDQITGNQFPAP